MASPKFCQNTVYGKTFVEENVHILSGKGLAIYCKTFAIDFCRLSYIADQQGHDSQEKNRD